MDQDGSGTSELSRLSENRRKRKEDSFVGSTGAAKNPLWKPTAASEPNGQVTASLFTASGCLENYLVMVNYSTTTSTVLERVRKV